MQLARPVLIEALRGSMIPRRIASSRLAAVRPMPTTLPTTRRVATPARRIRR
jgi:hypothetical protein